MESGRKRGIEQSAKGDRNLAEQCDKVHTSEIDDGSSDKSFKRCSVDRDNIMHEKGLGSPGLPLAARVVTQEGEILEIDVGSLRGDGKGNLTIFGSFGEFHAEGKEANEEVKAEENKEETVNLNLVDEAEGKNSGVGSY